MSIDQTDGPGATPGATPGTLGQSRNPDGGASGDAAELDDHGVPANYARKVGERLRGIRRQKRLSLQDVEKASDQQFKASVLGAYERGERAISVPRLQGLARFYSVPVDQLLPNDEGNGLTAPVAGRTDVAARVIVDLRRLESMEGTEATMLNNYLTMIQVQRQDFNGRMLTVRRDDMRAIACILGVSIDEAPYRLDSLGLSLLK